MPLTGVSGESQPEKNEGSTPQIEGAQPTPIVIEASLWDKTVSRKFKSLYPVFDKYSQPCSSSNKTTTDKPRATLAYKKIKPNSAPVMRFMTEGFLRQWELAVKREQIAVEGEVRIERQENHKKETKEFNDQLWAQVQMTFNHYVEDLKKNSKDKPTNS